MNSFFIIRENNKILFKYNYEQSKSCSFTIFQTSNSKLIIDIFSKNEDLINELKNSLKEKDNELLMTKNKIKSLENSISSSQNLIEELVSKNNLLKNKLIKYKLNNENRK